jgi:hypothetical protein
MQYAKIVLIGFCLIAGLSCKKESVSPEDFLTVSGVVFQNANPVSAAEVSIDQEESLNTTTDAQGAFEINDVPRGQRKLTISKAGSGDPDTSSVSFVERSYEISVLEDLFLENLRLPSPVMLYPAEFAADGIRLSWSHSDADDFREYKLYRHTSSGLDESTGTLIHISTARNDTTFLDETSLAPGDYFYRIFMMNDFGRLGASNIESITVGATKLIITIAYQGQETVSSLNRLFVGVYDHPGYPDFQDEGWLISNNASLELRIEGSHLQDVKSDESAFGPYYVASFLDVSGRHQGSSVLPSGSPAIVYDGINPFDSTASLHPTPIIIPRGVAKEIEVKYGGEYRVP